MLWLIAIHIQANSVSAELITLYGVDWNKMLLLCVGITGTTIQFQLVFSG